MPKMQSTVSLMDKREITSQGFHRREVRLTRTGVFNYRMKDGSVLRQLRHPEDVFDAASMATAASIPFTNEHPEALLDSKSAKAHTIGWTGDKVEQDDIFLKSFATIIDDKSLADIEAGKVEVSMGYNADLEETPGIYNGEPYDVRQKNIVYNHVSIVKRGRAGQQVRFLDSMDAEEITDEELPQMVKVKIGDSEFEVSAEVAEALKKLNEKNSAALATVEAKAETAQGALSAQTAKTDSLSDELKQLKSKMDSGSDEKFQGAVKARVALEKTAASVSDKIKLDGVSDLDIKKEVVKAKFPNCNFDGKDEVYVQARYDHALEVINDDAAAQAKLREGFKPSTNRDSQEAPSASEARKRMMDESQAAWKPKTK